LQKQDSPAIFISDSFYTWCSSVIKEEDGKYHMFYSRWAHGKRKAADDSMNYIFNGSKDGASILKLLMQFQITSMVRINMYQQY
jgi:hypothetical protein